MGGKTKGIKQNEEENQKNRGRESIDLLRSGEKTRSVRHFLDRIELLWSWRNLGFVVSLLRSYLSDGAEQVTGRGSNCTALIVINGW